MAVGIPVSRFVYKWDVIMHQRRGINKTSTKNKTNQNLSSSGPLSVMQWFQDRGTKN